MTDMDVRFLGRVQSHVYDQTLAGSLTLLTPSHDGSR